MYWNSYLPFTYKQRNGFKQRFAHPYNKWNQNRRRAQWESASWRFCRSNACSRRQWNVHICPIQHYSFPKGEYPSTCYLRHPAEIRMGGSTGSVRKISRKTGTAESWLIHPALEKDHETESFFCGELYEVYFGREESLIFAGILYQKQSFSYQKSSLPISAILQPWTAKMFRIHLSFLGTHRVRKMLWVSFCEILSLTLNLRKRNNMRRTITAGCILLSLVGAANVQAAEGEPYVTVAQADGNVNQASVDRANDLLNVMP